MERNNVTVENLIQILMKAEKDAVVYVAAKMPVNENMSIVDAGNYKILTEEDLENHRKEGIDPVHRSAVLLEMRNFNAVAHSVCGGEDMNAFYLLKYLCNWDAYGFHIDSAPLSESRRERYDAIMAKYRNHEIDGCGVTSELAGWLINFDRESRKDFMDWLVKAEL